MAPPAVTPSLEECYDLMEEMRRIYSSDEDAARMQQLQAARKQISEACVARETHMHELIKRAQPPRRARAAPPLPRLRAERRAACVAAEMSRRVADAEAKATPPEPADAHALRVMALEEAAASAAAEHEQLSSEAEQLSSEQHALASQRAAVAAARAESDAAAQARAAELQCAPQRVRSRFKPSFAVRSRARSAAAQEPRGAVPAAHAAALGPGGAGGARQGPRGRRARRRRAPL